MPEPANDAERAWLAACGNFFRNNDAEAAALIEFIQSSDPSAPATTINMAPETPLERSCGLRAAAASPELRARYLALKDAARAAAHAAALDARRRNFLAKASALPAAAAEPPCAWARVRGAADALGAFGRAWRHAPGANGVVAGLARLLRDQARSDVVLRWTADAAAVFEAPEGFVDAFCDVVRASHVLCVVGEDDALLLELDPAWSDRSLRRAAAAAGKVAGAAPHGAVAATDRARTNVDGELDETPPFLDRLYMGEVDALCPIL